MHYTHNQALIDNGEPEKANLFFLAKLKRGMAKVLKDNSTNILGKLLEIQAGFDFISNDVFMSIGEWRH